MSSTPSGWICPRCQRVNAPTVRQCQCGQREEPFELGPTDERRPPSRFIGGAQDLDRYSTAMPRRVA